MDTNYFVCTLGQAAALSDKPKPYSTVSGFLSYQAKHHGERPAIGFPLPQPNQLQWKYRVLNFRDVERGTNIFADRLSTFFDLSSNVSQTVALLSHSSPEFLFTWLGLIRLGLSVLLVAPQCQSSAIVHLCKSCNTTLLFHDVAHVNRAVETKATAMRQGDQLTTKALSLKSDEDVFDLISSTEICSSYSEVENTAVAYLHHTSGTSSGLPKPIPQTHQAAVGVLPHLPTSPTKATFTTTPLYHGGIADVFRSWTSDSLVWLFPGKDVPITARNVCRCLEVASSCSDVEGIPAVRYFSSVPYVLQMLQADEYGLELLQGMDIVGVGGAALPAQVGDRLVKDGVNLLSRFGSAECGFLLSSYRDFESDHEWQYLRNYSPSGTLEFESRDDGLSELVIKPGWPHMAKTNRSDNSFATADLFMPHKTLKDAWLYHSRADSQLTLITGKKFDPAPLEAEIATSTQLDDVLIFGTHQPFPGALLLRSEKSKKLSDEELLNMVRPMVERLNAESQDHARIPHHMLIPVPHQKEPLEKSSKGTVIRKVAEDRFKDYIIRAYENRTVKETAYVKDEDVPQHLIELIQSITSKSSVLNGETDLFSYGVDSVACMQLRTHLRHLVPKYQNELPLSIVEDCGTVQGLSDYVLRKRHGKADAEIHDEERIMLDFVKNYNSFGQSQLSPQVLSDHTQSKSPGQVVVLTGATGALGAHLLHLLRNSDSVSSIHCLVRGADQRAAGERVSKALEQRGMDGIHSASKLNEKIQIVQAQLSEPRLGLNDALYDHFASRSTLIIHVAWTVNFRLKLRSFEKDNIAGVKHLLDLATRYSRPDPPHFVYCSSTAAVLNGELNSSGLLPERISSNPASASPLGYSRSKWVAEQICSEAHEHTSLKGRVTVVRVGQLGGDSRTGVWNTMEAFPMMLSTAKLIGCLPDIRNEPLDWLPVDVAAKAFVEACNATRDLDSSGEDMQVFHVLNPHRETTWSNLLQWLQKSERFEIVSPREWVRRLEACEQKEHSAMKLLGLWKESYDGDESENSRKKERPKFDMEVTKNHVPSLRDVRPVDEEYVEKIWQWVKDSVG